MYRFGDTIAAVSSPTSDRRVIIRISGPAAVDMCRRAFSPQVGEDGPRLISGQVEIDSQLSVDAKLYLFVGPHSYTGETVAEIHMHTNRSVTESLLEKLLAAGCRLAEPGEFTARAYLNGKLDLAQAEAVNEVITCSNRFQLAAAEKLLAGQLGEITGRVCSSLMEALSLIEAGLDFSGEEIEFISSQDAVNRLAEIRKKLEELLAGSISYEALIDLPAVGIAGAPNAGKSSLLNSLLGEQRSIVSQKPGTTRDVLTGQVTLEHCSCVLFDCAGLVLEPQDILDELARQAAVESLRHSTAVIFCVDVSKKDWAEDAAVRGLIEPKFLLPVATKSDLLSKEQLETSFSKLRELFGCDFLITSAKEGAGTKKLREAIDEKILQTGGRTKLAEGAADAVGLTARHRRVVGDAISNLEGAIRAVKNDEEEVAAAMLRSAYQSLANIGRGDVDERILGEIFERFCIGK